MYVVEGSVKKCIASITDYDMTAHIDKCDERTRIDFENSQMPETFIEVEWTIAEAEGDKSEINRMSMSGRGSVMQGMKDLLPNMSADDIKDLI